MTEYDRDNEFGEGAAIPPDAEGGTAGDAGAHADAPPDTHAQFPWPPAEGESPIEAWGRTWTGASLAPSRFFGAMPPERGIGPAVIYYLTIGIAVAGAQLFWSMVSGALGMEVQITETEMSPLVDFLLSPLLLLASLFLAAGVTHVLLKLLGGAGGSFGRTIRVFGYAYSPNILGVIPYLGTMVGFVWMIVVAIAGLRTAHGTSTTRAAVAVLVPVSFALILMLIILLIAQASDLFQLPV